MEGYVDMEIPGYVTHALNRIQHTPKVSPKHFPHHHTGFKFFTPGTGQYAMEPDETSTISKQDKTFVLYIMGSLFHP